MFRLIALFAIAAVAVAEPEAEADPQWFLPHLKTSGLVHHPNGAVVPDDTVSVKAAKVQHLTAKANEYAMKGYAPYAATYAAPSVYRYPYNTHGMYNTYNYGAYRHPYSTFGYHHLFKREAESEPEADPQWLFPHLAVPDVTASVKAARAQHLTVKANDYALKGYVPYAATYAAPSVYRYPYNTYGMHNTYNYGLYTHPYSTSAYQHPYHRLFKREAESESQYAHSYYPYSNVYNYPYSNAYNYPYSNVYQAGLYPYSGYNTYSNHYAVPRYF